MNKLIYKLAGLGWALALVNSPLQAQGLSSGPDLIIPGPLYTQLNKGDSIFDPYVMERDYTIDFDDPVREQLVDVRFDVKADGSVENVRVLDGMYDEAFLAEATHAMEGSKFRPATRGGEAIDWPALEMRILFRGPFLPGISEGLRGDYSALLELVTAENFEEALNMLHDMQLNRAERLFEYALLQDQLATVHMAANRLHEGLIAARNATSRSKAVTPVTQSNTRLGNRGDQFPNEFLLPELYVPALRRRFLIAASLNQTGEAMEVYEQLRSLDALGVDGALTDLTGLHDQLAAGLAAEAPIGSVVKIIDGKWAYEVSSRRIFGVTGLQGQVDFIDIACAGNVKRRMAYTNDSEFALPATWENCTLEFRGEDGSQLTLYEYLN